MHKPFNPVPVGKIDRRRKENKGIPINATYRTHISILSPAESRAYDVAKAHNQSNRCYLCCIPLSSSEICIDHSINRAVCRRCRGIKGPSHVMDFTLFLLGAPEYHRILSKTMTIVKINRQVNPSSRDTFYLKLTK